MIKSFVTAAALALSLSTTVSAHGYVERMFHGGKTYKGFDPNYALWDKSGPTIATRHVPNDGPVTDFTSKDVACNVGAQDSAWATPAHIAVNAGDEFSWQWNTWPVDHEGPITVYMAACGSTCEGFDPTQGKPWFKIDQEGLLSGNTDSTGWATNRFIANNITWTATIPSALKAGAYLIRMEILALHSAGAPQFYPSCTQLIVNGSGSSSPAASELVAIPGIYTANTSTKIDIWTNGQSSYPIAGPDVTTLAKFTTDPINAKGGIGPQNYVAGTVVKGGTASSSSTGSGSGSSDDDNSTSSTSTSTTKSSTSTSSAATSTSTGKKCKAKKTKRSALDAASSKRMVKRHVKRRLTANSQIE